MNSPTARRLKPGVGPNPPSHPLAQPGHPPFPGQFEGPPMVPAPPAVPTTAPAPPHLQPHAQIQPHQPHQQQQQQPPQPPPPIAVAPAPAPPPVNPRKRRASIQQSASISGMAPPTVDADGNQTTPTVVAATPESGTKKKGRTNTPWTAEEEQRLKTMRDAGNTWSEIAKTFPTRTEGSVKKHWYKDMHYAEFAEDESIALREAIKEYEANKWKVIGQKVGKPAKACEQYAKEHFKNS